MCIEVFSKDQRIKNINLQSLKFRVKPVYTYLEAITKMPENLNEAQMLRDYSNLRRLNLPQQ